MLQRIINFGERITGVPIPRSAEDITEIYQNDTYVSQGELDAELGNAFRNRREWWLDVAKSGISDLVKMATGTHLGYALQSDKTQSEREKS